MLDLIPNLASSLHHVANAFNMSLNNDRILTDELSRRWFRTYVLDSSSLSSLNCSKDMNVLLISWHCIRWQWPYVTLSSMLLSVWFCSAVVSLEFPQSREVAIFNITFSNYTIRSMRVAGGAIPHPALLSVCPLATFPLKRGVGVMLTVRTVETFHLNLLCILRKRFLKPLVNLGLPQLGSEGSALAGYDVKWSSTHSAMASSWGLLL